MALFKLCEVNATSSAGDIELTIEGDDDPKGPRHIHWKVGGDKKVTSEGDIVVEKNFNTNINFVIHPSSALGLCIAKCVATSVLGPVLDCVGSPDYLKCLKSKGISISGHVAICIAECIMLHP